MSRLSKKRKTREEEMSGSKELSGEDKQVLEALAKKWWTMRE